MSRRCGYFEYSSSLLSTGRTNDSSGALNNPRCSVIDVSWLVSSEDRSAISAIHESRRPPEPPVHRSLSTCRSVVGVPTESVFCEACIGAIGTLAVRSPMLAWDHTWSVGADSFPPTYVLAQRSP